jgi:hypothetical protein
MSLTVREGDIHLANLQTRVPLVHGDIRMTRLPMAFVRVAIELDGRTVFGVSADLLPANWFTKNTRRDPDLEVRELVAVIARTLEVAIGIQGESPFEIWQELHETQDVWAETEDIPPLLAHFGTSLVERAVIDAFCRGRGDSFYRLLRSDQLGIKPGDVHPELSGKPAVSFLPKSPRREIIVRHTIGPDDPLTDSEINESARLDDGLPQSVEACVGAYRLKHFKIRLSGDVRADISRLEAIRKVLAPCETDNQLTLDGDEQFPSSAAFRDYWSEFSSNPAIIPVLPRLIFVEQPLRREDTSDVGFLDWPDRPPIIINESDDEIRSVPLALKRGYAGASHLSCKGVFRGIATACLLEHRRRKNPDLRFLHSCEDLTNVGPVALQQDLAVAAALGLDSLERNGHHHIAGLSWLPQPWQSLVIHSHGDLYRATPSGWPSLDIRHGKIKVASINESPFGLRFLPDPSSFTPAESWQWPPALAS